MKEAEQFEIKVNYEKDAKELSLRYKRFLKERLFSLLLITVFTFFMRSFDYEYVGLMIGFCMILILCEFVAVQIRKKIPADSVTFILNEKEVSLISRRRHWHWELYEINCIEETKDSIFMYKGYHSCIIHLPKYQLQENDVETIKRFFGEILEKKNLRFLS